MQFSCSVRRGHIFPQGSTPPNWKMVPPRKNTIKSDLPSMSPAPPPNPRPVILFPTIFSHNGARAASLPVQQPPLSNDDHYSSNIGTGPQQARVGCYNRSTNSGGAAILDTASSHKESTIIVHPISVRHHNKLPRWMLLKTRQDRAS